jgi:hypothetical protein
LVIEQLAHMPVAAESEEEAKRIVAGMTLEEIEAVALADDGIDLKENQTAWTEWERYREDDDIEEALLDACRYFLANAPDAKPDDDVR